MESDLKVVNHLGVFAKICKNERTMQAALMVLLKPIFAQCNKRHISMCTESTCITFYNMHYIQRASFCIKGVVSILFATNEHVVEHKVSEAYLTVDRYNKSLKIECLYMALQCLDVEKFVHAFCETYSNKHLMHILNGFQTYNKENNQFTLSNIPENNSESAVYLDTLVDVFRLLGLGVGQFGPLRKVNVLNESGSLICRPF